MGIAVGPAGFGLVTAHDQIDLLAQVGVAVLLFAVGLKLDLHHIRHIGPVVLATAWCSTSCALRRSPRWRPWFFDDGRGPGLRTMEPRYEDLKAAQRQLGRGPGVVTALQIGALKPIKVRPTLPEEALCTMT